MLLESFNHSSAASKVITDVVVIMMMEVEVTQQYYMAGNTAHLTPSNVVLSHDLSEISESSCKQSTLKI
ncbi:hypothetical protein EGR_10369 [Echinococcus granulosus]|uniref:Uncharacterized protein n=1 Tax=Echinococcus granulosus TaxID=6210 RepID=W6U0X5_ECHGR|nr:hypothetical protein EGR_10369 [Echinococcus granulosus]EUB54770.1 hypothetical protein EGR_10369 [Echinococcus granulosus]